MINKKYYNYDSIIFYKHCYFMNKKKQELIDQLSILEQEHKDLDEIINRLQENKTINLFSCTLTLSVITCLRWDEIIMRW